MKNDKIIIKFKKELYSPQILKSTAKFYKRLARFDFNENDEYTTVTLYDIAPEAADVIKDEYCNYAIYAMHGNR